MGWGEAAGAESLRPEQSGLGELGSRLLLAGQQQVDTRMNGHFDSEKDRERRWATFFFSVSLLFSSVNVRQRWS